MSGNEPKITELSGITILLWKTVYCYLPVSGLNWCGAYCCGPPCVACLKNVLLIKSLQTCFALYTSSICLM